MEFNGEALLLKKLSNIYGSKSVSIFDVGANTGHYASIIVKYIPNVQLHCFELVPDIFKRLENNGQLRLDNVFLNCVGLSDSNREVSVTYFPAWSEISGINPPPWQEKDGRQKKTINASVIKGDDYAEERGISSIGILKIDTEGHELFVLKGFERLLNAARIDVIQFEHGYTSIPSKTFLGDFYEYLRPRGYLIGRLYPRGVELKPYDLFDDEKFRIGNYVAIHESKTEILNSLNMASQTK